MVGLARADAADGDLGRAAVRLRRAAERLPLTSTLNLLSQAERALGHPAAAAAALDTARAQQGLYRAAKTAPDAEAVLFEADHGSPAAAVALGRRVWRAAPSVRSADALGWALTRSGRPLAGYAFARRALALGSRDAAFRLHAGLAAKRAGLAGPAARQLGIAAAARAALSPDARALLLGGAAMSARPRRTPRLALAALVAAVALALMAAPGAQAHPLGNFSVNHLSTVSVSDDHVSVRYVLDQAEIPTVQEDNLSRTEVLRRKQDEVARRLVLTVDGRRVELQPGGAPKLSFPAGAGGLKTTRVELPLRATVDDPRRVELHDGTFPGRIGWKAVVSAPGRGTAVRTQAPTGDPTDGLRRYPQDLLTSPLDRRDATFRVEPGDGTLVAPKGQTGGVGREPRRVRRLRRRCSRTPLRARACCCSCCWPPSAGARCTRSRPVTARRWSPPTWSAPAAAPRHAVALGGDGHGHAHDRRVRARRRDARACRSTCCRRTSIPG